METMAGIPKTIGILGAQMLAMLVAFGYAFSLYFVFTTVDVIAGRIVCLIAAM